MSDSNKTQLNADTVSDYLLNHPDFCRLYPEVLAALELDHGNVDSASLLEKQIQLLRHKNDELSANTAGLIENARVNEKLSLILHRCALMFIKELVTTKPPVSKLLIINIIESVCRRIFQTELEKTDFALHWFSGYVSDNTNNISVIDKADQRIISLINRLASDQKPYSGQLTTPEKIILFPRFLQSVASSVVALLVEHDTNQHIGLLVLLSYDSDTFSPGKGTMFLVQLIQLIESLFAPAPSHAN